MVVKVKNGWRVVSHKTRRNLGTFKTRKGAQRRLAQVRRHKHK